MPKWWTLEGDTWFERAGNHAEKHRGGVGTEALAMIAIAEAIHRLAAAAEKLAHSTHARTNSGDS